jgi:alpha-beta hydrolase superfamily lysophospholipase
MKKFFLIFFLLLLLIAMPAIYIGVPRVVVHELSRPKPAHIHSRSEIGKFPATEVRLTTSDGIGITGWFAPVPGKKAVVLLHGIGANRQQHLEKAAFYTEQGYAILCYDARSHGTSDETLVTGGWNEQRDLEAAVAFLREQGYDRIGLDGFSMGAATIAYANHELLKPDFIVLESCFKDVRTLIRNAVESMGLPPVLAGPVLSRITSELGVPLEELSPIKRLPNITAPTLMLLGDSEFQVHPDQGQEMFAASGAKIKKILVFEKAGHDIFSVTQRDLYRKTLQEFLAEVDKAQQPEIQTAQHDGEPTAVQNVVSSEAVQGEAPGQES